MGEITIRHAQHEGEAPLRGYRVSLEGGPAHPLTNLPGTHLWNRISPDGKFVLETATLANEPEQNVIVELATGKVRKAPLLQGDQPVQWVRMVRMPLSFKRATWKPPSSVLT